MMRILRCSGLLALASLLALLTALAHASPPDPSWIHGVYDDDDHDDVVVRVTASTGAVEQFPLNVCTISIVFARLHHTKEGPLSSEVPSILHARAPPAF